MLKKLSVLTLLVLLALVVPLLPVWATEGYTFEPPAGEELLFIGQDIDSIDAYVAGVGVVPGGVVSYTSINDQEGITSPKDHGAGVNYLDYLAETYPNSTIQVAVWIKGQLQNIVENTRWGAVGDYNERMDTLIATLVAYDRPIYLRLGVRV